MPVSLRREGDENDVRFLVLGGLGVVVREGEADAVEDRGPVATVDPFQVVEVLQAPSGKRYRPEPRVAEVTVQGLKREVEAFDPAILRLYLEEPEELIPDAEGAFWAKPILTLPYTNRVSRATIVPERIRLMPLEPPARPTAPETPQPAEAAEEEPVP